MTHGHRTDSDIGGSALLLLILVWLGGLLVDLYHWAVLRMTNLFEWLLM